MKIRVKQRVIIDVAVHDQRSNVKSQPEERVKLRVQLRVIRRWRTRTRNQISTSLIL